MTGENEAGNAATAESNAFDDVAMDSSVENVADAVSVSTVDGEDLRQQQQQQAREVSGQRLEDILDSLLSSVPSEAAVVAAAAMLAAEDDGANDDEEEDDDAAANNANDDRHSTGSDFYDEDDDVIPDEHGEVSGVNDTIAEDDHRPDDEHGDDHDDDDEDEEEDEEEDHGDGEPGADDRSGTRHDRDRGEYPWICFINDIFSYCVFFEDKSGLFLRYIKSIKILIL